LGELTREFGRFGREGGFGQGPGGGGGPWGAWGGGRGAREVRAREETAGESRGQRAAEPPAPKKHRADDLDLTAADFPPPRWAKEPLAGTHPVRELERLLDHFRDDIRDAARDGDLTAAQLRAARDQLAEAAVHLTALLKEPSAE
jgi:hypothetical protein